MTVTQLYNRIFEAGDSYVYFTTTVSKKQKYHICTVDFNSCEYILNKLTEKDKVDPDPGFLRVFCWDLDAFKLINAASVNKLLPLSVVMSRA